MTTVAVEKRPLVLHWIASAYRVLGPGGTIAAAYILLLVPVTIFASSIAPHDPDATDLLSASLAPSPAYWFGTDGQGRDIFSRVIVGSQSSLIGPTIVILAAITGGIILALLAAWFGGSVDAIVVRIADALLACPSLLLAIVAAAMFGTGLTAPVVALSIAYTPYFARMFRSALVQERYLPYIAALEVQGASSWRICLRHLLPALGPMSVAQGATAFGYALVDLAAISYLGLGVSPPTADWGLMVSTGQTALLGGAPEESLFAGLAIAGTVLAFVAVGSASSRALQNESR